MSFAISELEKEALLDLDITETNVRLVSLSIVQKRIKWLKYKYLLEEQLSEIEGKYNSLYKVTFKKIKTDSNLIMDKKDLEKSILADPDMIKAKRILNTQIHLTEFVDGILKALDNVSFQINNYVKVRAFEEGG